MSDTIKRDLSIPLSPDDSWAYINLPVPLSETQWSHLMHILTIMKPALVKPDAAPATEPPAADGEGES